jgi:uncharacterized protein (DUF2235 family)
MTPHRPPMIHVVLIDGTASKLKRGFESNIGLIYRLLNEQSSRHNLSVSYQAGIPWDQWRRSYDVAAGIGINRQIRQAYKHLAGRYRPGDQIYLFGYSRGAYAVRSLAGVIDQVGLLRSEKSTRTDIRKIYDIYQNGIKTRETRLYVERTCHRETPIKMIGVFDTVKSLGVHWPLLWRFFTSQTEFHNDQIGPSVEYGYHALAIHENRAAYHPILWDCPTSLRAKVEQVWFRGAHGDVGGHLGEFQQARPLANIPLCWMLSKAKDLGLPLPAKWSSRFPQDPDAPALGAYRGINRFFLYRSRRIVGRDKSEAVHPSAL